MVESPIATRLGIDNTPDWDITQRLGGTAVNLEAVRSLLSNPLYIGSGYRCPKLNSAVRGSRGSDHMQGYAVDFVCPAFGTPLEIVKAIQASSIQFDQCIHEGTWVHISFAATMRRQVLTAVFGPSGTTYMKGVA